MGYFSNGTEGMQYEDKYCDNCIHNHEAFGCPVLQAHERWNYEECNNKDSVLHKMIPLSDEGVNGECFAFWKKRQPGDPVMRFKKEGGDERKRVKP